MSASITTSPTTPFTSSPSPAATAATLPPFLASPPSATLPPAMTTSSGSSLLSHQKQSDSHHSQPSHDYQPTNKQPNKPSPPTSSSSSSYSSSSSGLSMHMPASVAANAHLATAVSSLAPSWAIAHDAAHPCGNYLEVMGQRNYHNIFHLPNLGGVIEKWLFTRPSMEAISEDSFANSAVESMTLFRIEGLDRSDQSVLITPTVSSHYLFIPCQTINGYTVGLAYLDILYERDSYGIKDNRVPPLRLGRFVIDDATGEMFCTAWMDNLMVVAWTQSIIKCERVREFLLFEAPKDGTPPRSLLLRNSFFERRSCALCGLGRSISTLPPPCSGIDNRRLSQDPASSAFNNNSSSSSHSSSQRQVSRKLTNIAAIYRRFRGSYFGVVLKTRYGTDRQPQSQQLVPVFAELKHGLHTVKVGFKNNLRKNIDFVLGGASNDGYFGMNPRSAAKSLLLLRASNPVEAYPSTTSAAAITDAEASSHHHHDRLSRAGSVVPSSDDGDSSVHTGSFSSHYQRMSRASSPSMSEMWSTTLSSVTSKQPQEQGVKDVNAPKRRRSEDPLERDSVMHKRKVRNRISAQRSNKQRKLALDQKKADLERLKLLQPVLEKRLSELRKENEELRVKVYGNSNVGNNNDGSGDDNNNSNSRLLAMMSMTQVQAQQGNTVGNELLFQEQYQDGQQLQQQGMDIVHLGEQQQQQQLDDNGMNVDVIAKVGEQHQQILQQQQLLQLQQQQQQGDGGGGGNDNENVVAGGWTDEDAKMENVVNITDPCLFVR